MKLSYQFHLKLASYLLVMSLLASPGTTARAEVLPGDAPQNEVLVVWEQEQNSSPEISVLHPQSQAEAIQMIEHFAERQGVQSVEQNRLVQIPEAPRRAKANTVRPNDPDNGDQWALARLHATEAWSLAGKSRRTIKVAVIDTGVDLDHPDLAGRIVGGYDYVENDPFPDDEHGHGTHVSGIIAALTDNGLGVSGLAGKADVHIIPLKILDEEGNGSVSNEVKAIYDAVKMGAAVINMSLGATLPSKAEHDAIRYATEQGVLVVAAAGNEAGKVNYPAAYPDALAVAATNDQDRVPFFSNNGPEVDLAAPGLDIISTVADNDYAYMSGTSMAAPHVSALAALLQATSPKRLAISDLRALLANTAADIEARGKDRYSGHGRIDFLKAVKQILDTPESASAFTLEELMRDPDHYFPFFTHYASDQIMVTTAKGSSYSWKSLLAQTHTLTSILKQEPRQVTFSLKKYSARHESEGFIRASTPSWGGNDVSLYPSIEVQLDASPIAATLQKYVRLIDSHGRIVTGTTLTKWSNNRFTLDADSPLSANERYRVMFMGVIPLASFTTTARALEHDRHVQSDGPQRNVSRSKTFEIEFNQAIDANSVNAQTVWIENDRQEKINAIRKLSRNKREIQIRPVTPLKRGGMYFLIISVQIRSQEGIIVGKPSIQPFRVKH